MNKYRVGLSAINIPEESYASVEECMRVGAIGQSEYVERFEEKVAAVVGSKYCIATSSGTMADAVALAAMREYFSSGRVVIPALTFIAQANAARYAGLAIEFVDVLEDWTLNLEKADWVARQDGFVFVTHLMGRMGHVESVRPGSVYLEDACEAFGSSLHGRWAGTWGQLGTYSFFVSHSITTGEGGAIVTDNLDLADLCRQLRSHGRASDKDPALKFTFPLSGFNAKMSGLTAALGLGVVQHAYEVVGRRRKVFLTLNGLMGERWIEREGEWVVPHGYPIEFGSEEARDTALHTLVAEGIECRKFFSSIPTEGAYKYYWPKKFPTADYISRTHLYIPCHQNILPEEIVWMSELVLGQKGIAR